MVSISLFIKRLIVIDSWILLIVITAIISIISVIINYYSILDKLDRLKCNNIVKFNLTKFRNIVKI